jgi:hypothetical protein
MEAIGFKKRLNDAKDNSEYIKIIFQYPGSDRAIIKSGKVISVDDDSFTIQETMDGEATYSYQFIVEIKIKEMKE